MLKRLSSSPVLQKQSSLQDDPFCALEYADLKIREDKRSHSGPLLGGSGMSLLYPHSFGEAKRRYSSFPSLGWCSFFILLTCFVSLIGYLVIKMSQSIGLVDMFLQAIIKNNI